MFNLVFFYTEGKDKDKCIDLSSVKPIIIKSAKDQFDNIAHYTPSTLKKYGYDEYVKEYERYGCVSRNPYANYMGFFAWKPLIMLLELEKMNDGDILVYRDSNIKKLSNLNNYTNIKYIAEKCLNICGFDFFISRESENLSVKNHTKDNVINELGENHIFTSNFPLLIANFIIIRKSKISMILLNEWIKACTINSWINGDVYCKNNKSFRWYTPEQSILSVIISNWVRSNKYNIPLNYPRIGFKDRNYHHIIHFKNYKYLESLHETSNV